MRSLSKIIAIVGREAEAGKQSFNSAQSECVHYGTITLEESDALNRHNGSVDDCLQEACHDWTRHNA